MRLSWWQHKSNLVAGEEDYDQSDDGDDVGQLVTVEDRSITIEF